MKRVRNIMGRLLDAAQRRFSRARPGSVLIMVVALLVLLALIGTAAMSTARMDRVSSRQHVNNTEIDMLAESVKEMVIGQLVGDLFRIGGNDVDSALLDPEAPGDLRDAIIGSRVPERQMLAPPPVGVTDPVNQVPPRDTYVWRNISYPPIQNGSPFRFDPPNEASTSGAYYSLPNPKPAMVPTSIVVNGQVFPALQAYNLDGSKKSTLPLPPNAPPGMLPPPYRAGESPFLAADTDGDGIADAILFKLPISPLGGITYYAAVRVIDNAAAINPNTAWNPNKKGTSIDEIAHVLVRANPTETVPTKRLDVSLAGVWPGSVMMEDLLDSLSTDSRSTEMAPVMPTPLTEAQKVNGQRFLGDRRKGQGLVFNVNPINDSAGGLNDFIFLTAGDALHNQLGRRLDNPGYYGSDPFTTPTVITKYGNGVRPFGVTDAMALARLFTITNPVANDSTIEKTLFMATINNNLAVNKPYAATASQAWFNDNFDYLAKVTPLWPGQSATQKTLMRSLFTPLNPVRNYVQRHAPDFAHKFQQIPVTNATTVPQTAGMPSAPTAYATKTNANTASFSELWASYYDVMCDSTGQMSPFDGGAEDPIYQGMQFNQDTPFDSDFSPGHEHGARMFRSSARPIAPEALKTPRLHPFQMLALRAAIAAANTIALREKDDWNPPYFHILLPQVNGDYDPTQYKNTSKRPNFYASLGATVYGIKRQPFITEVLLNNNPEKLPVAPIDPTAPPPPPPPPGGQPQNPSGFAAIEFHNPYDVPMDVSEWKLSIVDRHIAKAGWDKPKQLPTLNVIDLPDNATKGWDPLQGAPLNAFKFGGGTIIPPHGFLVVSNLPKTTIPPTPPPSTPDAEDAQYAPANSKIETLMDDPSDKGVKVVYLRALHYIMDQEVVLYRPINVAGATGVQTVQWAPIDSFDCTGIKHQAATLASPGVPPAPPVSASPPVAEATEWHYVRSNDRDEKRAWHFVYPGRYDASDTGKIYHHQGTEHPIAPWLTPDVKPEPWLAGSPTPAAFGKPDKYNSRDVKIDPPVYAHTFPIQIANGDLSSQFLDSTSGPAGKPGFPFNGFLRAGDLMQVTYIGSYHLWDAGAWSTPLPPNPPPNTPPSPPPSPPGSAPTLPGPNGPFVEVNSLPMDAAFAEDTDPENDNDAQLANKHLAMEDIGHFTPLFTAPQYATNLPIDLTARHYTGTISGQGVSDTFNPQGTFLKVTYPDKFWNDYDCIITNDDQSVGTDWKVQLRKVASFDKNANKIQLDVPLTFPLDSSKTYSFTLQRVRYGWATRLLDYFTTINSPADDFLPNANKTTFTSSTPAPVTNSSSVRPANRSNTSWTEDDVPSEGLININTASWKVLAQLPLVMDNTGQTVDKANTEKLARRIVYYRDVDDGRGIDPNNLTPVVPPPHPHGPFRSLMELCLIPEFVTGEGWFKMDDNLGNNPGTNYGDFSPVTDDPKGDYVRGDFKEKYLMLNRISNLVTVRSDCYTGYIQVQGWRDAGTPGAKLVAQRRLAFIVDRSPCTPTKKAPKVYNVPTAN